MKKKITSLIILSSFFMMNYIPIYAETIHGYIEETSGAKQKNEQIFTKEVKKLENTKEVELTVSQVLNGATSIEGDEFFAEVSQDVMADTGVLIPRGTIAHGTIRNIAAPKRLGRNGYIELSFDYLVTPDGREIQIDGNMTSKLNPAVSTSKVIGESVLSTAVGGAYGAVAAIQLAGIEGAVLSHGYTLAGGAAIGGVIALGMCLFRKGQDVLISPGDEIKIKIASSEPIQVMKKESKVITRFL